MHYSPFMLKDPYIWGILILTISHVSFYIWLNNMKNYKVKKQKALKAFKFGWPVALINTSLAFWILSFYQYSNNLELMIEVIIGMGNAFCWVFWIMCKDGDLT